MSAVGDRTAAERHTAAGHASDRYLEAGHRGDGRTAESLGTFLAELSQR